MKVSKFAKAELKKIFLRPIMLIVFVTLVIGLTVLTLFFNQSKRSDNAINFSGANLQTAFNNFLSDYNENSKTVLDNLLIQEKNNIEEFILKIENENQINTLTNKISQTEGAMQQVYSAILNYNTNPSEIAQVENAFANLKSKALDVRNYLSEEFTSQITFYMTENNYETLQEFFRKISQNIPDTFEVPQEQFLTTYQFLATNFNFSKISTIVQNATTLPVTSYVMNPLIEKYYTKILDASNVDNLEPKLNALYKQITTFVLENADSVNSSDIKILNEYLSQYKSISVMSRIILHNEFLMAKAGTKTDTELKNYIGFEEYNAYNLKQSSIFYSYLLENESYDYNYLNAFSYSQSSGTQTNAFDFTFYAMQILSVIIAIYVLFIASGTVSNEQANGTMKMLAIRPFSRNKIISGKLLACLNLMFILLLICFASSFAVGYISYGFSQTQVLLVFNASKIFTMNSFVLLAIFFVLTYLKLAFFITLAFMLSVVTKSSTLSIIISAFVYIFSLIANSLLIGYSWFSYLPFAHLDLYRYFGPNSQGGIFDFNMPLNANIYISIIYLFATTLLFYIISLQVFKKRNIS